MNSLENIMPLRKTVSDDSNAFGAQKIFYSNNVRIPVIKPRFILSMLYWRSCIRPSQFIQAMVACPPILYLLDFS
jgi:hypothetical protein